MLNLHNRLNKLAAWILNTNYPWLIVFITSYNNLATNINKIIIYDYIILKYIT